MLVYLARPNDHARGNGSVASVVTMVEMELERRRIAWFDPIRPYGNPMAAPTSVWRMNETALQQATGVLAVYPAGVPSTGTPMEIKAAADTNKPLVVLGGAGSLQLMGMGVEQFELDEIEEAVTRLLDQMIAHEAAEVLGLDRLLWTGAEHCAPCPGAYAGDAGWDLVVEDRVHVPHASFRDVPMGISVQLPRGHWAMITGRSSTLRRRGLLVMQGIIDNGYRGPLFAGVQNLSDRGVTLERGERIAQLIPFSLAAPAVEIERVDRLGPSDRGERAFGSTGN